MSLVEHLHAQHIARLVRLSPAPKLARLPKVPVSAISPIDYQPFDAGWDSMWHYDLVSLRAKPPGQISVRDIQRAVCEHYNVSSSDMLSHSRVVQIATPRHVAMYLAKKLTLRSLTEIGYLFGRRDHTTVLHAVRKIEALYETDNALFASITQIRRRFI